MTNGEFRIDFTETCAYIESVDVEVTNGEFRIDFTRAGRKPGH